MTEKEIEELYDSFMQCVNKVEQAKTDKARAKWLKLAKEDHEDINANRTQFSSPQLRRIKRSIEYVESLETE
ncbi:MAG: hypothetical protein ACPG8W_04460 [Candidatus Promineifilaceae bacterium]